MIIPVFADGPLKGRDDITVSESGLAHGLDIAESSAVPWADPLAPARIFTGRVHYRFCKYRLLGRDVAVGICGDKDSAEAREVMWDLLTSNACKAAAQGGYVFERATE